MALMTTAFVLMCLLAQTAQTPPPQTTPPPVQTTPPPAQTTPPPAQTTPPAPPAQPTIVTRHTEAPSRNVQILFADDAVVIAARTFSEQRDAAGAQEPALFAHSKEKNRWIQILAISTVGGRLGRSWSDDPQAQRKLRTAPVGWDFTGYAGKPYIEQPLKTTGSVAFPDRIIFDPATDLYEFHYFSSFGVDSAETVLFISRTELLSAFIRR